MRFKAKLYPLLRVFQQYVARHLNARRSSDFWFLMGGNWTSNLNPDPSFGHNLCVECPNGSCEPILNIYVPRTFEWYKDHLNTMGFDPCNNSLKIPKSIETPTPKVGVHLGVWGCDSRASLSACTLANLYLGREPKVKVVTLCYSHKCNNVDEHLTQFLKHLDF
jgi:hypothetical protein